MKEILIAGDLLPTPSNFKLIENAKIDVLLKLRNQDQYLEEQNYP